MDFAMEVQNFDAKETGIVKLGSWRRTSEPSDFHINISTKPIYKIVTMAAVSKPK